MSAMKIQGLSDLHLEHGGSLPDRHPETDAIVLAGDLVPFRVANLTR